MESKQGTPRVLLDTSFILPSLGVDVFERVTKGLNAIATLNAEIYYSQFSILESLWVAARLLTRATFDAERFSLDLRSVIEEGRYSKVEEDSKTYNDSLKLYALGHRDMIDNILYVNSVQHNTKLLTLDDELGKFLRQNRLDYTLLFPEEIRT